MHNSNMKIPWLPSPIIFTKDDKDRKLLLKAYQYGNECSPDPSTKNGAIIVDKNKTEIMYGVNKFPIGVAETQSRLIDKATKYRLVVHAESSAVFNSARHGKSIDGSILYCPFYSCSECAKAIIQAGISRVVGHLQLMTIASKHTTWVQSIFDAWEVMHEAKVECVLYDGEVGTMTRFNGQDIRV